MPERCEMLHGFANSLSVVDLENANVRQIGPRIDKHQRKRTLDELLDQFLFDAEGHDGDAVDTALQHAADERLGAGGFVVCGADEDLVALLDGEILELLHQFGEKWIGDLRDHEAEDAAAAGDERAGLGIGHVAHFLDGAPHALRQFGGDGGDTVYRAGNCGDGDAGALRHVANARAGCTKPVRISFLGRPQVNRF